MMAQGVRTLVLALLLKSASVLGARRPGGGEGHGGAAQPSQFEDEASSVITISVTITPMAHDGGVPVTDDDRMEASAEMLDALNAEYALRHADGQVPFCFFARERGTEDNNAHLQADYDLKTTAATAA